MGTFVIAAFYDLQALSLKFVLFQINCPEKTDSQINCFHPKQLIHTPLKDASIIYMLTSQDVLVDEIRTHKYSW